MNFRIGNRAYDILKWIALAVIPATEGLWLTVGKAWGFPYLTEIGTTIAAIGVFIAAVIGVTSSNYYADGDIYDDHIEETEESEDTEG